MDEKRRHGQFYTVGNPFDHQAFHDWVASMGDLSSLSFVEPFAGSNDLILMSDPDLMGVSDGQWSAYDIAPEAITTSAYPSVSVCMHDSIADMPSGAVVITNPPYLAKNSAHRRHMMDIDFMGFNDLWEVCVDKMLHAFGFIAAIIPESFITRGLFHDRLADVISITDRMFDDSFL